VLDIPRIFTLGIFLKRRGGARALF